MCEYSATAPSLHRPEQLRKSALCVWGERIEAIPGRLQPDSGEAEEERLAGDHQIHMLARIQSQRILRAAFTRSNIFYSSRPYEKPRF